MPRITHRRIVVAISSGVVTLVMVIGVLVIVSATCSPQFDRSDLVGVYVANYPSGTETLTLNHDGAFEQEVRLRTSADATPTTQTGTWEWDDSRQYLDLADCMAVNDGFGDIRSSFATETGCSFPAGRKWGLFGQILLGDRETAPLWKVD